MEITGQEVIDYAKQKYNIKIPEEYTFLSADLTESSVDRCLICLEETTTVLSCSHNCCQKCIDKWFKVATELTCPYCKKDVKKVQNCEIGGLLILLNHIMRRDEVTRPSKSPISTKKYHKNRSNDNWKKK